MSIFSKIARGFSAFKTNTGKAHPNDQGTNPATTKRSPVKRATGLDPLTDDLDGDLWQGGVSVGTPLSAFTGKSLQSLPTCRRLTIPSVDFDTGSSDFFLPGPECTDANCQGHKVFQTGQSSTAVDQHKTFSIEFADGSTVAGEIFTDTVNLAGLTATKQAVVAATQYSDGFVLANSPPDGLLGLAFESIANTGASPVFQTLVTEGQTTSSVFGVTLLDNGGELFLGGTDTSAFTGSLAFADLIVTDPPAFWEITASSVSVGNKRVVTRAQDAIVDTGTTLLIVDPNSATEIFAAISGSRNAANEVGEGFFTIPCNDIPSDVSFTVAGEAFTLSPDTLNFGQVSKGSSDCIASIIGADLGKQLSLE